MMSAGENLNAKFRYIILRLNDDCYIMCTQTGSTQREREIKIMAKSYFRNYLCMCNGKAQSLCLNPCIIVTITIFYKLLLLRRSSTIAREANNVANAFTHKHIIAIFSGIRPVVFARFAILVAAAARFRCVEMEKHTETFSWDIFPHTD